MACIRKRRGKYVVDYRDGAGVRRWVTCATRREAEDVLDEKRRASRQAMRPVVDPDITVEAYAERWLALIRPSVRRSTASAYERHLRRHLLPGLGTLKIRQLYKGRIKVLLVEKLAAGLASNTVAVMHCTVRAMLNAAVDDGVILANPAARLGRQLRLRQPLGARQDEIKAMTEEQLAGFLAVSERDHRHSPLVLLLARTGMRLGEALGLQWEDVDFPDRQIRVARTLYAGGRVERPKSGYGRTVDMSQQLAGVLRRLLIERKAETLRRGWREMPPWVFCSETGGPLIPWKVEVAFKRMLKTATLPLHFTPHGLRHTYASLLLQKGVSPVYVQRQLGHHSIKLTVDLYGRWLPMGNPAIADLLDRAGGSKVVAAGAADEAIPADSRAIRSEGGRRRGSSEPASG